MGDAGLSHGGCKALGNLGLIEGAGLPVIVLVSWEMQSSVMGDAELSHGRCRAQSWEMQSSVMGDAELSHWRCRARSWEIQGPVMGDAGLIKKQGFIEGAAVSP
jgi:hypothetical protein